MLGLRRELADRHVFDHAPAQRAHRLVGHGGAPVLSEVGATPRSQDRTLPLATPIDNCPYRAAGGLPRERFSPLTLSRHSAERRVVSVAPITLTMQRRGTHPTDIRRPGPARANARVGRR